MKNWDFKITSFTLHILAMIFMLSDHLWAARFNNLRWMTCLGRLSFPIFAFLIVEGFFKTKNIKKYLKRLLIFAIISEIPFDLFYSGIVFDPTHQNVLWTYLIALLGICFIDKYKQKQVKYVFISLLTVIITSLLSIVFMTDFFAPGILMIFTFYFFHKRIWWNYLLQFISMYYINMEIAGGFYYPISFLGHNLEIIEQGLAIFSLIPIWLYNGNLGYCEKWFKNFCYLFYPIHLFILAIIQVL